MSLSSLIVQRGIGTIRQVEEALARQVLYGGDLLTNLMEVASFDEAALTAVAAEAAKLPPGPWGPLPSPDERSRSLIPPELAVRRSLYPLALTDDGEQLLVLVAEPLTAADEEQLMFTLGVPLAPRLVSPARLRQALAREFGAPLDKRFERLLARLQGEVVAPVTPEAAGGPALVLTPTAQLPFIAADRAAARAAAQRAAANAALAAVDEAPPTQGRDPGPMSARPARRRRGPLTLDKAAVELEEVADRDALLDLFFDFSRQYFEYSALFIVHGEAAEGRDAYGSGASRDRVVGLGVPLDLPSILAAARQAKVPVWRHPAAEGLDPILLGDLERRAVRGDVLVVPLVVRGRVVALLYGDGGDAGVVLSQVSDVTTFAVQAGQAFERLILKRKLGDFTQGDTRAAAGRADPVLIAAKRRAAAEVKAPPTRGVRAEALGRALFPKTLAPPPYVGNAVPPDAGDPPSTREPPSAPVTQRTPSTPPPPGVPQLASRHADERAEPERVGVVPAAPTTAPSLTPPSDPDTQVMRQVFPAMQPDLIVTDPPDDEADRATAPDAGAPPSSQAVYFGDPSVPPPPTVAAVHRPSGPPIPREEPGQHPVGIERPFEGRRVSEYPPAAPPRRVSGLAGRDRAEAELTPLPPRRVQTTAFGAPPAPSSRREPLASDDQLPRLPHAEPADSIAPTGFNDTASFAQTDHRAAAPEPWPQTGPALDAQPMNDAETWPIAQTAEDAEAIPEPPPSQTVVIAPYHPPSSRTDAEALPSIIVDVGGELAVLVDRLLREGSDDAGEAELLRQGQHAMPVLMARFPGPIVNRPSPHDAEIPPVATCGPLLRLIAAQRRIALPFVLRYVDDLDEELRYWATYLITELPYPEALPSLIPRLSDPSERVRRIAMAAAAAMAKVSGDELARELGRVVRDAGPERVDRSRRLQMLSVLEEIRCAFAIPTFISVMNDTDEEIATAARKAMVVVARQDFGRDPKRWTAWWNSNSSRDRIEWLIDALVHESGSIRRAAGEELKAITKEYFGYYDDLPKRDRERAQARYREWWRHEGHLKFTR